MNQRLLVAVTAAAAVLAGTLPAQAAVDEIIVTAQRREQKLQEVPLAVSAFDISQITNRQIDAVKDIGQNIPNLQTYTVTAGAQAIQVHSRGASAQNPGFNLSESPVGIYIDDVYFGRLASVNTDLTDVERIEVLRGPQGTLYGRNTIAGAIKIVTRTPGDDRWLNASVGIGNYETTKFTGSVGGPIEAGSLAGSMSALYENRSQGWQNNPVTGNDPGEYKNKAARAKLHWYGTENFDAVLTAWAADVENDGYNGVPYTPFASTSPSAIYDPAPANSVPLSGFYANLDPDNVNYGSSDQAGVNLALSFQLGSMMLKSITGYANIDDRFGFDLAGGGNQGAPGATGLLITSDSNLDQFSQEFQLLGKLGSNFDWQLGLFYLNEDGSQSFDGDAGSFVGNFAEQIENTTNSYAVYGEGTYQITEALSVIGGLRWTKDDKDYKDTCFSTPSTLNIVECRPSSGYAVDLSDDWDEVTGRLSLNYQLNDDQLVYLGFSQGYQSGGFRTLCLGDLTAACGGTAFDPQTVDSIEAGWKADLFDKRLRINAAAFYAMYSDIQQVVINANNGFPIDNIGDVDVYGLELEVVWAPIDALNVYANLGIQESDFGSVSPLSPPGGLGNSCSVDPTPPCATPTDELPSNPKWQGKIGFDYNIPLENGLAFFYGLDVFHSDNFYSEARNLIEIDSYTRLNGFLGFGADDRKWQVTLTGKNLTDEEDNTSGIFANQFTNIRTPLPPAEYMLNFKVNY
ncbi:MAG: TonB-dependent receptor [Gammaproteobacteria bacterium]